MRTTYALVAAVAAVGVSAEATTTYYATEYYTDCSNVTSGLATATGTIVETYCPHCTEGGSSGAPPAASGPLTTYTTVYKEFCSTAPDYFQTKTYTVTESCSSPGAPRPSDHVPEGFVVTTATCHVCAETPVVATLTTPTPQAPSAAPANSAPAPAPALPTGSGSSPASPPPAGSPGGSAPAAPSAGTAPGSGSSGSSAPVSPAGAGSAPGQPAPGPGAKAPVQPGGAAPYQPAGAAPVSPGATGASVASNSSFLPFTGSASNLSLSTIFTTIMMAAMGLFAFAL